MKPTIPKKEASYAALAVRCLLAIFLFVVAYMSLLSLAGFILYLFGSWGIQLILAKPNAVTLILGLLLIGIGGFFFFVLTRFLFRRQSMDVSHLIEVKEADEPKLFSLVKEVVSLTNSELPRKVYLAHDVSAAVLSNASFWSIFLPLRKNLSIGLGLMETLSIEEFKAVLAHEFGHFSQKSLRLGAYVHVVNNAIHAIINDNATYSRLALRETNVAVVDLFLLVIESVGKGISWILSKIYNVVNINYLALSRKMEFQADQVAVATIGSRPFESALLRLPLAEQALVRTLHFYESRISDGVTTANIYPQLHYFLQLIADDFGLDRVDSLPLVTPMVLTKFDKSKLVLDQQWESHPSLRERVAAFSNRAKHELETKIPRKTDDGLLASSILVQKSQLQEGTTTKLFANVQYSHKIQQIDQAKFAEMVLEERAQHAIPAIFNRYYDGKAPSKIDFELAIAMDSNEEHCSQLFSDDAVEKIDILIAREEEHGILSQIALGSVRIPSFDYDGRRYRSKEAEQLVVQLTAEIELLQQQVLQQDMRVYRFFHQAAIKRGLDVELKTQYEGYHSAIAELESQFNTATAVQNAGAFIETVTPVEEIFEKIGELKKLENALRKTIKDILSDQSFSKFLNSDAKEAFQKYLSQNWKYFLGEAYDDSALQVLSNTLSHVYPLLMRASEARKVQLLQYFTSLLPNSEGK
jgi:Zn-dependent protease with chaperone function